MKALQEQTRKKRSGTGQVEGMPTNPITLINEGRIHYRDIPKQQSLENGTSSGPSTRTCDASLSGGPASGRSTGPARRSRQMTRESPPSDRDAETRRRVRLDGYAATWGLPMVLWQVLFS